MAETKLNNLVIIILIITSQTSALSYNQPKFCPLSVWNPNGKTFADQTTVGASPLAIFVNTNNTLYVLNRDANRILVWLNNSINPTKTISGSLSDPHSMFTTNIGDIYVDNGKVNRRVDKWISNTGSWIINVMNIDSSCEGLFVDINNTLYCSMMSLHKVVRRGLNDMTMTGIVTAGTGVQGSAANELSSPMGIFIDVNFDLYVADCGNSRIQLFQSGELNGKTIAGDQSIDYTITLNCPSGIVLDTDKYLFIVDHANHRIVGSGPYGFRCLVGCNDGRGSQSNQLAIPFTLSFDSYGNMFISDQDNHRIQKFVLSTNSCTETTTQINQVLSYNQPKFCPLPIWNQNGITLANQTTVGKNPTGIFVTTNNTIYVATKTKNQISIWLNDSKNPTRIIPGIFLDSTSIFVTNIGDIYIDNGRQKHRVDKWISSTNTLVTVMYVNASCEGLFVDINNTLYCSMMSLHKVVRRGLNDMTMTGIVTAGTGVQGSAANELSSPMGIFIDVNFDLYVADCGNSRIQLFQSGELNGKTIAGDQSIDYTITLNCPSGIVLDTDKYLFIVDHANHRIVGSGPYGFRCLVGCNDGRGSQSNQLAIPFTLSFDSYGNMFISDQDNHRIQKFVLSTNSCTETTTQINQVPSYNQPKFCPLPVWNPNGITLANQTTVGDYPTGIFITSNNTIYVATRIKNQISIWLNDSTNPTRIIPGIFLDSTSIFVTNIGDIYIDNGGLKQRVDQWNSSINTFVTVMYVNASCTGLFIDINDTLYCSIHLNHAVVKRWLNDKAKTLTIAAGTGVPGSAANELNSSRGIFVDVNFDLYVADCRNNRIQLFQLGELNGKTIAGDQSIDYTITLNCPSGIVLDADKYLFIVDMGNHRIVGSGSYGFRCLIGCDDGRGSQSNQLALPFTLSFDSYGNMFISDQLNNRIQKFLLLENPCDPTTIDPITTESQQDTTTEIKTKIIESTTDHATIQTQQDQASSITTTSSTTAQPEKVLSFNQPTFCPTATWNSYGSTFTNQTIVGNNPIALFIDTNNTVYASNRNKTQILVWSNESTNPTKIIAGNFSYLSSIFVTNIGDIYFINGGTYRRVDKWISNTDTFVTVLNVNATCFTIFVDINDTLYCSIYDQHKVVRRWLMNNMMTTTIAAGTGSNSPALNELNGPMGIFVDLNFNLYVADCQNDRIQLFQSGELYGKTIAGQGPLDPTITLSCPSGVLVNADKDLFIVDSSNHRIIGSSSHGFRCLLGCNGRGSQPNQLKYPRTLSFDSFGNIFISDRDNHRIQKFHFLKNSCALSYNRPKFSPTACWDPNGITFANQTIIGDHPLAMFINTNNTIYVASYRNKEILIWQNNSINPTKIISGDFFYPGSIFVTNIGDIYIDNVDGFHRRVDKLISSTNTSEIVLYASASCYSLFVDINDTVYCSVYFHDQVVKRWLHDINMTSTIAAGTGRPGSAANELTSPQGIFVDINFDLYVADCNNDRVQLFQSGQLNGTTVAGNGSINDTITLDCPTGIFLDADKYLFIAELLSHRIVGSGPNGFRCLVGCNGQGSQSNQLSRPHTLSFDSDGNIFIADTFNNRIQKFLLSNTSCDETTIDPMTTQIQQDQTSSVTVPSIITHIEIDQTTISPIVTEEVTSTHSTTEKCLIPPSMKLIPETIIPLEYQRNEEIFLSSSIQFFCNKPFVIFTKWTIYNFSSEIQFNSTIIETTYNDLYIPSNTLSIGLYQLKLTVTTSILSNLFSSKSIFIQINPSGITLNLIPYGLSMITHGYLQDLQLNPGKYSIDHDGYIFNPNKWTYKYSCRIYQIENLFITFNESMNSSCLLNQSGWGYNDIIQSSLTIFSKSFQLNSIYEFYVEAINYENSSIKFDSYLLVQIQDKPSPLITINCFISTLCIPRSSYQLINPQNQLLLNSQCIQNCSIIQWKIYQSTTNVHNWTQFNQTDLYENISIFGLNTSKLTITKDLFKKNNEIKYWKFEVIYSFETMMSSSSSLNFLINQPPSNGFCEINPSNGTIKILFNISCLNWVDEHSIKDYSLFYWKTDPNKLIIIAFSSVSNFQVRLPSGYLHLVIHIRDKFNSYTQFNLSSIQVLTDINYINESLATANLNTNNQIIASISHEINQLNDDIIAKAVSKGIPAANIYISLLDSQRFEQNLTSFDQLTLDEYKKDLNNQSNVRESFIKLTTNRTIKYVHSINLQSSTLAHLTQSTNQLTRRTLLVALEICFKLSTVLHSIASSISYEDAYTITSQLLQCASNILTGFNGPLQQRTIVLDSDVTEKNDIDGNENILKQKQLYQMISLLTSTLIIHLNIQQNLIINTSQVYFSIQSLSNQNQIFFLRSIIFPLASYGNHFETNLSRSVSYSILNQYGTEVPILNNDSIEIFIPRDKNLIYPEILFQNVSSTMKSFDLKYLSIESSYSIHFEIYPFSSNQSYLFIYQFDNQQINFNQLNGFTFLCYQNLTNESYYSYYISNQQTVDHHLLLFGLRELNSNEILIYCSNKTIINPRIINEQSRFTSNYQLRIYSSSCFYHDENNQWKTDRLTIGPKTNLYQTQCFFK